MSPKSHYSLTIGVMDVNNYYLLIFNYIERLDNLQALYLYIYIYILYIYIYIYIYILYSVVISKQTILSQHIYLCLQLELEAPGNQADISMFTMHVRLPIFIQIVNVLDLHFQRQRFELCMHWGSSYAITSQTVTDRADIAITAKQEVAYGLSIGGMYTFLTSAHSIGQ